MSTVETETTLETFPDSILVKMDARRQMLCLESVWEIDAIARSLPGLVEGKTNACAESPVLVRALAGRILRLTRILMGSIGDETEPTERLERIISLDGGQG